MSCSSNGKNIIIFLTLISYLSCTPIEKIEKKEYIIKSNNEKEAQTKEILFPTQKFKLSKTQNYEIEEKFLDIVEESYLKTYETYKINFNYTITPEGVIYPYSEVSIKCITEQKNYTNSKFEENCIYFFEQIKTKLSKIKGVER